MFSVGQEVVCVDPGKPANPWHQAHPLIKGKHYVILDVGRSTHANGTDMGGWVSIDRSGRHWNEKSFRPLRHDPVFENAFVAITNFSGEYTRVSSIQNIGDFVGYTINTRKGK